MEPLTSSELLLRRLRSSDPNEVGAAIAQTWPDRAVLLLTLGADGMTTCGSAGRVDGNLFVAALAMTQRLGAAIGLQFRCDYAPLPPKAGQLVIARP